MFPISFLIKCYSPTFELSEALDLLESYFVGICSYEVEYDYCEKPTILRADGTVKFVLKFGVS